MAVLSNSAREILLDDVIGNTVIRSKRSRVTIFSQVPALAVLLWVAMWTNLNTGFWNIQTPSNLSEWTTLLRAVMPFAVLPVAAVALIIRRPPIRLTSPSGLLFAYGIFATIATVFSPAPQASYYWSLAFLATILAAWTFIERRNPIESIRLMLYATWAGTFIVAAIVAYQGRNSLFGSASTAYGIIGAMNGLTRSSGVARWAAVPGLVCIVRAFHARRIALIAFYLGVATVAFFIVYRVQSRGAVFGAFAALIFIVLVSSRMRRYALSFATVAIVALVLLESPEMLSSRISTYLYRGQNTQQFQSMTGRTHSWRDGLQAFDASPIFGYGQWADRITIGQHVHNSYLSAMLNSGIVGAVPYFASWIAGWWLFFRLLKRRTRLAPQDRLSVLECGTVMMFFTVRAIPETTTAEFSVDLLVMTAVYVYLETLRRQTELTRKWMLVPLPQLGFTDHATILARNEAGGIQ